MSAPSRYSSASLVAACLILSLDRGGWGQAATPEKIASPITPPAASTPPPTGPAGQSIEITTVPLTDLDPVGGDRLPVTAVRLNDSVDARFLVDTGTSSTGITASLAKKLGLTPQPASVGGKAIVINGSPMTMVQPESLQVGAVTIARPQLMVLPDQTLQSAHGAADGILGLNFLSRYDLLLDFPAHRMTLLAPRDLTADQRRFLGFGPAAEAVPLTDNTALGLYTTPLSLTAGRRQATDGAIVDTGSFQTQISATAATRLHLSARGPLAPVYGLHDQHLTAAATVDELRIGTLRLTKAPIHFLAKAGPYARPTLGMDLFSRYRVLIEFASKTLSLAPADTPAPAPAVPPTAPAPEEIKPAGK